MPAVLPIPGAQAVPRAEWIRWAPVLLGLLVLYVPTGLDLARNLWTQEEYAHGPIVLAVVLWLLWQKRARIFPLSPQAEGHSTSPLSPRGEGRGEGVISLAAWPCLTFGLLLYILGRSQDIILFEVGSMICVLAGALAVMRGWGAVRLAWFPLFFILFMIPLPSIVIDALTGPLKQSVSIVAENLLYSAGYPIARSGVVLTIGQYQLLVADACSGLNSMFSLSALGLLYIHLVKPGWLSSTILIASLIPVAFTANVTRVVVLVLVTWYFGDAAGQGFAHDFAGMLLFIVALLFFFILDAALAAGSRMLTRACAR